MASNDDGPTEAREILPRLDNLRFYSGNSLLEALQLLENYQDDLPIGFREAGGGREGEGEDDPVLEDAEVGEDAVDGVRLPGQDGDLLGDGLGAVLEPGVQVIGDEADEHGQGAAQQHAGHQV